MDLAVTGGTGRTGALFVDQAAAAGHHLRVLARRADEARERFAGRPTVTVVPGDLRHAATLDPLVAGADAVVSLAGPVRGGGPHDMGTGARHLVAAMERHGVRRLVWLTGAGVRRPEDEPAVVDRAIVAVMSVVARRTLLDSRDAVATVTASGLDWTVVRAPRLVDGPAATRPRVAAGVGQGTGTAASRATVAAFVLQVLAEASWRGGAPVVSD